MKLTYFIAVSTALAFTPFAKAQHCGAAPAAGAPSGCCAKKPAAEGAAAHCDHAGTSVASGTAVAQKPLPSQLAPIFANYTVIQKALVADSIRDVAAAAGGLGKAIRTSGSGCLAATATSADKLAKATDLEAARKEFAAISDVLIQYLSLGGHLPGELREAYCPMAKASWLQKSGDLENPYMGKGMLNCGRFKA